MSESKTPSEPAKLQAEHMLTRHGLYAGHQGLRGLLDAAEFWERQPYGTRLYYGPGNADYFHRSVLSCAIKALDEMAGLVDDLAAALSERDALAARVEKLEARVRVLPEPVGYISTGTYYWLVRGKADHASIYGTGSISAHKTDKYTNPVYMEPNDAALSREEKS